MTDYERAFRASNGVFYDSSGAAHPMAPPGPRPEARGYRFVVIPRQSWLSRQLAQVGLVAPRLPTVDDWLRYEPAPGVPEVRTADGATWWRCDLAR
jgi:hypothetical protein